VRDEQVLADSADSARVKVKLKWGIPKSKVVIKLIMRKGSYKPSGLKYS